MTEMRGMISPSHVLAAEASGRPGTVVVGNATYPTPAPGGNGGNNNDGHSQPMSCPGRGADFLLLLGSKRMPDAARSLGSSMRILKAEVNQMQAENTSSDSTAATTYTSPQPIPSPLPSPTQTSAQRSAHESDRPR
ncbi:twin-arginine translocase TatA/TatE family subunit [Nocardia sp. NPDC059246]|uniref:twin-arginine translocase TatA/TatE family subunit n=1 Tax=unclassified Nocardia TaxID=2637762 RepID=UPI0036ACC7A8